MPISSLQHAMMLQRLDRAEQRRAPAVSESVNRESDIHDAIIEYCKQHRWYYIHSRLDKPTTQACGVPDFVIATDDGRTLWIEVKRKGGKLTPAQQGTMHWLERNKQLAAVVYSFENFLAVVEMRP